MRTIPEAQLHRLTPHSIMAIWSGPAQTGGHRSDEIQYPQVLDGVVQYARTEGPRRPAHEVAATLLYRLCHEQPFGDCNKRTGLIIATGLMESAGFELTRPDSQVWVYLNKFATNFPTLDEFIAWFGASFEPFRGLGP